MTFVRLLPLSIAAMSSWSLHQLDIKNAFFHGDLAGEVYMEQPTGFVAQGESGLVCRICRSLYGLKQSLEPGLASLAMWYRSSVWLGVHQTILSSIIIHHTSSRECIYLIVYVNDIVMTSNDQDGIRKLKHLFSHFQKKTWGNSSTF